MRRCWFIVGLAWATAACALQPLTATPAGVEGVTFTAAPVPTQAPGEPAASEISPTPVASSSPTESDLVAGAGNLTTVPSPTEAPLRAAATDSPIAAAEQHTIDLINAQRAAVGVPPLAREETLMGIARARVADMVARGYTGHYDPVTGESLARSLMRAAGFINSYLGENWYGTTYGPPALADNAMNWFMADPPHAKNILNPNYAFVGVGIAFNGQLWLLVQDFAGANR